MVIVTGADSKYLGALANLAGSIHFWMPGTRIAVFDLGFRPQELDEIASWRSCRLHWAAAGPPVKVRVAGRWKRCPHMRNLRWYAWKPTALVEAVQAYGTVLWLDAGSDLRGPLGPVEEALARDGYFLVKGQDLDMTARLHEGCPRRLGLKKADFAGKPSFAGGIQGYVQGSAAARELLIPMYAAACDKSCIAPAGSSLGNHRYDQSILSLLAYTRQFELKDHTDLLCVDRAELEADPGRPSSKLIYTARGASVDYIRHLERR